MHYFIFPQKDTTLYTDVETENAGIDSIIELHKINLADSVNEYSRVLIQFNLDEFSASLASGVTSGSEMKYYLNLYTSEAYEIPLEYTVEIFPMSTSWENGTGRRGLSPVTTNGASWKYKDGSQLWIPGTSGSLGGVWITGSGFEASQSFTNQTTDLHVEVTDIVEKWLSGSLSNYGFMIKHTTAVETGSGDYGFLKFFSNETHTVYRPRLEVVWKDFSFEPPTTSSARVAVTSSDSWVSESFVGYFTHSFYTGGLSSEWVTQSATPTVYVSESYGNFVSATDVFVFNSSTGLYVSESYSPVYDSFNYTYVSASDTQISRSIISYTTSSFYTASLGSEYQQSASSTTWASFPTFSNSFTKNVHGVFVSQSFTFMSQSNSYASESITGYTSQSVNDYSSVSVIDNPVVVIENFKPEYRFDSFVRFDIGARKKYPDKVFRTGSWYYLPTKFLPSESYYSVRDAYTEEEIVPFSVYSQISADVSGSYFNLYLKGFEPERFYRILLKLVKDNLETIYDKDYTFRVIR